MTLREKFAIGTVLTVAIIHLTVLFFNILDSKKNLEEAWEIGYDFGYKEFITDHYLPRPGLDRLPPPTPSKVRNRKLIEKFKG